MHNLSLQLPCAYRISNPSFILNQKDIQSYLDCESFRARLIPHGVTGKNLLVLEGMGRISGRTGYHLVSPLLDTTWSDLESQLPPTFTPLLSSQMHTRVLGVAVCDVLLLETGALLNWVGKVVLQIFFSWILTLGFLFGLVQQFLLEDLDFGRRHPVDLRKEEIETFRWSFADFQHLGKNLVRPSGKREDKVICSFLVEGPQGQRRGQFIGKSNRRDFEKSNKWCKIPPEFTGRLQPTGQTS